MKPFDDLIYTLHSHPQFDFLMQELRSTRPVIPSHDPLNDNAAIWKQKSAQQAGFDICLNLLKIRLENT